MVATRSKGKAKANSLEPDAAILDSNSHSSDDDSPTDGIENHISEALNGLQRLRKELKASRAHNKELQRQLQHQSKPERSSKLKSDPEGVQNKANRRVRELRAKVKMLEQARIKYKTKIKSLQIQEAKRETLELEDGSDAEAADDSVHRMRKLLREFHDLMLATSLEEGESCPICLDPCLSGRTSSLPCQHVVCNDCLPGISRGADETVKCPQCRGDFARDDVELVHYTASEQWDALLEVAKRWAAVDHRGQENTSDEEAEEDFIKDSSNADTSTDVRSEHSEEEDRGQFSAVQQNVRTPSPAPLSYSQSPTRTKRERLEQLAQNKRKRMR